jgi:hypothetical protein
MSLARLGKPSEREESNPDMEVTNCNLEAWVGRSIVTFIPIINKDGMIVLKLMGVETGGIWVYGEEMGPWIQRKYALADMPKELAMFIPFSQINFLLIGVPSSEGPKIVSFPSK